MSTSTTRRAVLAGAAAAPALALPAVADAHPDAELLALGRKLEEAARVVEAGEAVNDAILDRVEGMIPPRPDHRTCPQEEWNHWRDLQEQARAECGATEASKAFSKACREQWAIADDIIDLPALTLDGLCVKVRAIEMSASVQADGIELEAREWQSLAADIRRLAGKAVAS